MLEMGGVGFRDGVRVGFSLLGGEKTSGAAPPSATMECSFCNRGGELKLRRREVQVVLFVMFC